MVATPLKACEEVADAPSWKADASWKVLVPPPEKPSPSMLSRYFASRRDHHCPEVRTDATLSDVVDSALRSLHQVSQRHKPSAQALAEGFAPASRQEMLVWLLQAFDVMHFNDSLLFDTALLLDRYYATQPPPEDGVGGAQRKLLAAVCTALKTGAPVEQLQLPLRQVVTHLGREQVPFDAVLVAELAMLRQLRFQVATPTAKDFIEALTTRLGNDRVTAACTCLADFLLQLTLMDAPLHYRHPHAILAASALALALYATKAPPATYAALLEDLALHCPDAANHQCLLVQCTGALHLLWVRNVATGNEQPSYARFLVAKFGRENFHWASSVAPPPFPPSTVPPMQSWGLPCAAPPPQDDFEEAIGIVHQSMTNEERRVDPLLSNRAVTWDEMCQGLADQHFSDAQLRERWSTLRVAQEPRWLSVLSDRLRGLAESSWKVRWVLARHGWNGGKFRIPPNRQQLLNDLVCTSRNRTDKSRPSSGHSSSAHGGHGGHSGPRSPASVTLNSGSSGGASAGCGGADAQHLHSTQPPRCQKEPRRRRAASWCGQRSSGRAACLATRSPGPPGPRGVRPLRASSRSP